MIRRQGFRFELKPDDRQERLMRRFAGSCRFVYNRALAVQEEARAEGGKRLGYGALCRLLTAWRRDPETAWLAEAPIHPLQQALRNLDRAYANLFAGRAEPPRFKKRGRTSGGFRYPDPAQIKLDEPNARVFLPKLGWVRYRKSREVEGTLRNVTVSCRADRWFVSIQTERAVPDPVHPSASAVGVDLGIVNLAVLSDGTFYEPAPALLKQLERLAALQRKLSRKQKGSKNRAKARARVRKLQARIADIRTDRLHKVTTAIAKNHSLVVVEDLHVKAMSASARGTKAQPGKNVRAKARLNRAILDRGWGEFRRMLAYKLEVRGGLLVVVPPQDTSRRCPACGFTSAANRTSQACFACVRCGHTDHADVNAALNILAAGHAVIACGGVESLAPSKQEPAEATRAAHAA